MFESHCYQKRKMDIGMAPCTEGAPIVQTGSKWKTSDVKAQLDLLKKKKKREREREKLIGYLSKNLFCI